MRLAFVMCVGGLLAACAAPPAPTLGPARETTLPLPTATVTLPSVPTTGPKPGTAVPTPSDGTLLIQVGDYFFMPAYITVTVGTTVIWHPVGELFHTIVPKEPANAWRNGVTAGMGSRDFEWTFTRPNTIFYHCDYHPGAMDAILVVVEDL